MRISFLDNYKFLVLKNLIAFAFFLAIVFFAQPSNAISCSSYEGSTCKANGVTLDKETCEIIKSDCDNLNSTITKIDEDLDELERNCPLTPGEPSYNSMCIQNKINTSERLRANKSRETQNFESRVKGFTQKVERDQRECRREISSMNRAGADLPPGCRARGGECLTDAQKCRRVRESIGAAGVLSVQFQGQLATECPQAAKEQFDENSDELETLEGKLKTYQEDQDKDDKEDLEKEQKHQNALQENQEKMQELAKRMEERSVGLNQFLSQPPPGITEQMNSIRLEALNINRKIRGLSRQLTQLQSNDTREADQASQAYQSALRGIAIECNKAGSEAIVEERRRIRRQAENRQTTQNLRQASEDPADRLRLVGARAYASCRNSAESQNTIEEARHTYQSLQRELRRAEGALIDQIQDLEEQLVAMNEQLDTLVEQADKEFNDAQEVHRRGISEAVRELNDLQHKNETLEFYHKQETMQKQSQYVRRQQQYNVDNGTYMALQQAVEAGRPGSYFSSRGYGEYKSIDSFAAQYENAHHTCCDNDRNLDPKLCSSNSAERYLRSGSSRSGRSRGAR